MSGAALFMTGSFEGMLIGAVVVLYWEQCWAFSWQVCQKPAGTPLVYQLGARLGKGPFPTTHSQSRQRPVLSGAILA